jgi:hypothetical protein
MYRGLAEVSWRFVVQDGEVLLALRCRDASALAQLKAGDLVQVAVAQVVPDELKEAAE